MGGTGVAAGPQAANTRLTIVNRAITRLADFQFLIDTPPQEYVRMGNEMSGTDDRSLAAFLLSKLARRQNVITGAVNIPTCRRHPRRAEFTVVSRSCSERFEFFPCVLCICIRREKDGTG